MRREREEAAAGSWGKRRGMKEGEREVSDGGILMGRIAPLLVRACARPPFSGSALACGDGVRSPRDFHQLGRRAYLRTCAAFSRRFPRQESRGWREREKKIRELGKPAAEKTAGRSKRRWLEAPKKRAHAQPA